MASLDAFNELPMNQRVGIIGGIGAVIALVMIYFLYTDLGKLGLDKESSLSFMMRDSDASLWTEIRALETEIKNFNSKAAERGKYQDILDEIDKEIEIASQILPKERERSVINELLGQLAKDVVDQNLGVVLLTGTSIEDGSSGSSSGKRVRKGPAPAIQAQKITFKCDLSCDINGLIAFINKAENSVKFLTVDAIKVTPGDISADLEEKQPIRERHTASLEINTWVLE